MFRPKRVIFEQGAKEFALGKELYERFLKEEDIEIFEVSSNRVSSHIPGKELHEKYQSGKQTLVVGVKKSLKFQSCKPSAHYQLPIVSGCMGQCEYCYLNTQLGDKPYVRVHVNIDEILEKAGEYIKERLPDTTIFEGAATSDPLPVEPYTHALESCIRYFGQVEHARFRFVSKYTDVESLLSLPHNGHTEIRFSLNTDTIIQKYEHHTPTARHRIKAATAVAKAGYSLGFIIAPVFLYDGWVEEYQNLLLELHEELPEDVLKRVSFEVISHRYTLRAKGRINEIFPENQLPMKEEERQFKYGQFGYGKYLYPKEDLEDMKTFFISELIRYFPESEIKYII
ncbi:spore photoproduct lyase [Clostridium sp. Marseille-P299]|uniref:spore photoproduct lyase n=1 Tax=Clostridium sp. Marseille-P299 TaxID=1805477 RepID=UPI000834C999|nr:spore photoproduct lyase [Clostridium sp. Marseille-P299]